MFSCERLHCCRHHHHHHYQLTVHLERSSLSIQCEDHSRAGIDKMLPEYRSIFVYASLMVVIIPIGVPAILFTLLWWKRDEIERRQTRRGGPELKYLSFLFRLYGREHCEFEINTGDRPLPTVNRPPSTNTLPYHSTLTIYHSAHLPRVLFDDRLLPAHHPLECGALVTDSRDSVSPRVHRQCVLRAHVP